MPRCILVFGVSGVGKTTACRDFAARHPEWLLASASALLASATGERAEQLRAQSADRIADNQDVLVEALRAFRAGREDRPVMIDAHAVIDNDVELVPIPTDVVGAMGASELVLLEAPAAAIAERRRLDPRRRPLRSLDQILREMAAERETAETFSETLGLPLSIGSVSGGFVMDGLVPSRRA